ncbi:MAG: hypothetical protein IJX55_10250 [Clostridia bacterium]|nr:hypothetical protein [Clostridia bacterium]
MKCPECNSENIMEGILTTTHGVVFTEKGTEYKFRPNSYKVECKACNDCGKMFDFRIIKK